MVPPLSWLDEDKVQAATVHTPASGEAAPTTLDLSNRPLTHASLRLLPGTLTCLDLTRCGMESLEALARLPLLELLNVSYNRLTSLDALQHSSGLKVVFARSNRITSLAALESLPVLQSLDLECNALDTLDALRPLRTGPHTAWARRRGPQSHLPVAPALAHPSRALTRHAGPRGCCGSPSCGYNPVYPGRNYMYPGSGGYRGWRSYGCAATSYHSPRTAAHARSSQPSRCSTATRCGTARTHMAIVWMHVATGNPARRDGATAHQLSP